LLHYRLIKPIRHFGKRLTTKQDPHHYQHWWVGQMVVQSRDEHGTGPGLDWIRTTANFVEIGLDQECKSLQNLGTGSDLD